MLDFHMETALFAHDQADMAAATSSKQYECTGMDIEQRIRDEHTMRTFVKLVSQPEVKTTILESITAKALEKANLMRNILLGDCHYKELHAHANPFDWDMDSLERRLHAGERQVDTLEHEDPETLLIHKMLTDLSNVEIVLGTVKATLHSALAYLRGCEEVVAIREKLGKKYTFNRLLCRVFEVQLNNCKEKERLELNSANERVNELLDRKMLDDLIVDPIYWRHYVHTYLAQFDEHELRLGLQEKQLREQEETMRDTIQRSNIAFNETMTCFHNYNKRLKSQIEQYTAKYDTEFEKVNNECSQRQMALSALQATFAEYKQRACYFRAECDKMKAKIRAEEERARAEELKKQAAEQQLLATTSKKKKKKTTTKKQRVSKRSTTASLSESN